MMTVDGPHPGTLQLVDASADRDQVRVHQLDKRPAKQEVEADERQKRGRVVKHPARSFLDLSAFLDEIGF